MDNDGVVETRGNDNDVDSPGGGKGTRLVKDIRTGMVGSKPHHLLMYNGNYCSMQTMVSMVMNFG